MRELSGLMLEPLRSGVKANEMFCPTCVGAHKKRRPGRSRAFSMWNARQAFRLWIHGESRSPSGLEFAGDGDVGGRIDGIGDDGEGSGRGAGLDLDAGWNHAARAGHGERTDGEVMRVEGAAGVDGDPGDFRGVAIDADEGGDAVAAAGDGCAAAAV